MLLMQICKTARHELRSPLIKNTPILKRYRPVCTLRTTHQLHFQSSYLDQCITIRIFLDSTFDLEELALQSFI